MFFNKEYQALEHNLTGAKQGSEKLCAKIKNLEHTNEKI